MNTAKQFLRIGVSLPFLGIVLFFTSHSVEAQRCANTVYDSIRFAKNPALKEAQQQFERKLQQQIQLRKALRQTDVATGIVTVPVVVHVLYNSADQNISDAQVRSQIKVLNQDYRKQNADTADTRPQFKGIAADMQIQFCLAASEANDFNGITRHYVSQKSFSAYTDDAIIKSYGLYPTDQYLNIWVCNLNSGFLGYAQLPGNTNLPGLAVYEGDSLSDGVVIATRAFGTTGNLSANYALGRTATHEVGHWLGGLIHTWGDVDCSGSCNSCGTDYCDDTPVEEGSSTTCQYKTSTKCTPSPSVAMIENFMNYTYDRCMSAFTADQKTRLHTAIQMSPRRMKLLNFTACEPQPVEGFTIKLFPNPVSDVLNLELIFRGTKDVGLEIYDTWGQKVLETQYHSVKSGDFSYPVHSLSSGMYIVRLLHDGVIDTQKFVVLR